MHSPENSSENGADFFFFINIYASLFQWLIRDLNIEDWGMYLLLRKIKQRYFFPGLHQVYCNEELAGFASVRLVALLSCGSLGISLSLRTEQVGRLT